MKVGDPNEWEFVHLRVWEQHNGPIPPGMVIRFLDGDRQNLDPANLVKVSKAEHIHLNRREYNAAPADVKPVLFNLSKLEVKLFEVQRNGDPKEKAPS